METERYFVQNNNDRCPVAAVICQIGALAANKPLVLPGVGKSGIDNLQGNRIVMVTKHHDPDPRRLRTSEK